MDERIQPASLVLGDLVKSADAATLHGADPHLLTILVPTYRDDPGALIRALAECAGADDTRLVIFDDGSGDPDLLNRIETELETYPGKTELVASPVNVGRAEARNRLLAQARTDWVLLLDADMLPDDALFLGRYFDAIARATGPALVAGGFSLKRVRPGPQHRLHALQSARSECLNACERSAQPGRYVFTSNILVHRDILASVPFDDGYKGWGWEDVDWGLCVSRLFPVQHIDNTATHLGLDTDAALMAKYGGSGANFARLVERHPEIAREMPLYRMSRHLARLGALRAPTASACGWLARQRRLPGSLRLLALKLFRALHYSRAMT